MSSDLPRLRFDRPLRRVRTGGASRRAEPAGQPASEEEREMDERARQLDVQARELAAKERELALRAARLAEQEQALEERLERLARLIGSVQEEKAEMLEANEEQIVSLSLSITEKVLQHEIEHGRYKIGEVVKSALQAVRDRGAAVVRVNPHDYELARSALQKLAQAFGTTRITTVPDESIPLASCCIETESGKIFSEIPGRLERIETALLAKGGEEDGD